MISHVDFSPKVYYKPQALELDIFKIDNGRPLQQEEWYTIVGIFILDKLGVAGGRVIFHCKSITNLCSNLHIRL